MAIGQDGKFDITRCRQCICSEYASLWIQMLSMHWIFFNIFPETFRSEVLPETRKGHFWLRVGRSGRTIPVRAAEHSGRVCLMKRSETAILPSLQEVDDAVDRIVAGMEGTRMTDGKSKSLVAYHEVGHAICG